MNGTGNKCLECRIKSSAASALTIEELSLLSNHCTASMIRKGETVFNEGDPAKYVTYIREGFVKQFKNLSGKKEQIINVVKRGSYLGLHNLVPGTKFNYVSARAIKRTTVCRIEKNCFCDLVKRNGEFASRVINALCEDEIFFVARLLKNQQQQLYGRLADALLYFRHLVYNKNPFVPDMSRAEIASFIGTSRESVTRALIEFQESGFIRIQNKQITICNEERLKDLIRKG